MDNNESSNLNIKYFTDNPDMVIGFKNLKLLHSELTPYQKLEVYDSKAFGLMLILDDIVQYSQYDGDIYTEEMIKNIMNKNNKINNVLIVGGGDGFIAEKLNQLYPKIKVTIVDIDKRVWEVTNIFFRNEQLDKLNNIFTNTFTCFMDAFEFVKTCSEKYDAIIMDTTDPDLDNSVAKMLISKEWYNMLANCLQPEGLVIQQLSADYTGTESKLDFGELKLVEYATSPIILTYNGRIKFVILQKV